MCVLNFRFLRRLKVLVLSSNSNDPTRSGVRSVYSFARISRKPSSSPRMTNSSLICSRVAPWCIANGLPVVLLHSAGVLEANGLGGVNDQMPVGWVFVRENEAHPSIIFQDAAHLGNRFG